ncbi:hypothetical protein GAYE_SCF12G3318 [Galdieria yellowstonensis]|uniref:Uncharacterized protein n=1 Tax=Galdieria yellowstonensis TaxID=3028027 RepID=A0AAV9IDG1_9RHOD|nr:hypothetical protein GAYE_SCF12G3318 [Galdieria yellowstonensis]
MAGSRKEKLDICPCEVLYCYPGSICPKLRKMLPVIKQQNPNLSHQEAFKRCAESWKDAPENPKNQASA